MTAAPAIALFRNDLRIEDNPALHAARESGAPVIALYVLDEGIAHAPGGASRWWLHHSLAALGADLEKAGTRLTLREGDTEKVVKAIVEETGAKSVFWNRRYYAKHIEADKALKAGLTEAGISVESFNGALLREPREIKTNSGGPYRVFTPFWKSVRNMGPARKPLPRMRAIEGPKKQPKSDKLKDLELLPQKPNWAKEFETVWTPGESGARDRLKKFLKEAIENYSSGRDRPDCEYTSRLSPHLAFGEISPVTIWTEIQSHLERGDIKGSQAEKFLSELCWREFCYNLLFYNEELPEEPLRKEFAAYPWRDDEKDFQAWTKGLTGYPIVDAGMRQLWRTGWMHNRVRMIVASFLIKDLLIPWRKGEAWFWDTLADADLANNAANWQWVAGCGADAAPYFRIFNPVTQGEKFDPDGDYVRKFVPELADLPAKYIHQPWSAPENVLQKAGVTLGISYPDPIVNHAKARRRALEGYDRIRNS